MGWREAARLAGVAFDEVALQATYAFRQGNPVPPGEGKLLPIRAKRRVVQSKALIAVLLGLLTLGDAALLRAGPMLRAELLPAALPLGLYRAGVLAGLLGLDVALLWWTGIQAIPTYIGSLAVTVLESLPIERRTLRQAAAILFLRLFDLPAAVVLVGTPLLVGLTLGPLAGVAAVPAAFCATSFALALALATGRSFVRRVQGARGGGGGTVVRWLYLLAWLLPAFGLLGFVTLAPPLFGALARLPNLPIPAASSVTATFPLALSTWPALAAGGTGTLGLAAPAVDAAVAAGVGWTLLAVAAAAWLYDAVARVGVVPAQPGVDGPSGPVRLRPQRPAGAVLTKDLRLASRTPGYAFLILLPLLDSVALGFVTYAGASGGHLTRNVAFGAVSAGALLATFFGPAFFALEVVAQSYGRTLPLAPRALALGKVTLVGAIYLASGALVLGITALKVHAPLYFAAFVAAELPAIVAAGLLELSVLLRWARRKGLPVTTLYAANWNVVLVALPGIAVAAAPLATFAYLGLAPMAVVAVAALAVVAPWALGRGAP